MRLGACNVGLGPPVVLCCWSYQGICSVVVLIVLCFVVEVLCCLSLVYV